MLGLAIEKISGLSYRDYVRKQIFAPVGMTQSDFLRMDRVNENVAEGSDPIYGEDKTIIGWQRNIYSYPPIGSPDSGAYVTAGDLDRFLRAVKGGQLLSPELTAAFFTQFVLCSHPTPPNGYGCGLRSSPMIPQRKPLRSLTFFRRRPMPNCAQINRGNHTMNLQARPCREPADLARMKQLLMAGSQANISASYMHPGLLDYHTYYPDMRYPPDEQANRRNLRLWENRDEEAPTLAAWAIFSRLEGSFDLFVQPALHGTPRHEAVMDDYVAWAEARAHEAGLKQIMPWWAMEYDKVLARLHQAHGFVVAAVVGPSAPLFERTLDKLPAIPLPAGFSVQGVSNAEDGRLRAQVTHGAFSANDDWEAYAAAYAQFIGTTVYNGERDLFVRSPDGRGAAACTIWFDPVNGVGLFEPVGTHPDFQGKGLGKAVMAEGMRRMKAAGMTRAIVGFDPTNVAALALYTSMGFAASAYFTFPRKELS